MNSNELDFNTKDSITWLPFEKQTVAEAPREDGVYIFATLGVSFLGVFGGPLTFFI